MPQADRRAQPSGTTRVSSLVRALKHRNYRLFFGGQIISLTGTWMQSVAQSWLVYRLSGSSVLLGLVGFATQIPVFALAAVGGTVADRHSRHRILIITQSTAMVLAFALAALTLSARVAIWEIFVLATLLGVVNAFDIPARQAFAVDMVGKADLINAIALNSSMVNGARVLGPALAGILVASVGEGWCFLLNGVSYMAVIAGLLAMRLAPRKAVAHHPPALAHMAEGFRYVGRTRPVRALLLLLGLVSLSGMPYAVLMPIFAGRILHGGARGLGILMAMAGAGALVGALSLAARRHVHGLGRWIAGAAAGFGASLTLFSLSHWFWVSALLLLPVGFFVMVQMAASNTLIQVMVPDALRGRVMAVYSMMFMGMAPFGALTAGLVAARFGAPRTVAAGGIICLAGAMAFALFLPRLRGEVRALIVAQEMTGGEPSEEMTGRGLSAEFDGGRASSRAQETSRQ
ncbi:MAG: MFS transporter [Betaproteobacteria bacterium]|nr:MFS transporter [Betaproteobacteria bacterium]